MILMIIIIIMIEGRSMIRDKRNIVGVIFHVCWYCDDWEKKKNQSVNEWMNGIENIADSWREKKNRSQGKAQNQEKNDREGDKSNTHLYTYFL